MPANAWTVAQLAEDTEREITNSHQRWTAFLTTAARLYKYPYREQLMIFAQRPEATACAEYDLWNKTMRRYVRRGSKGIALVDTSGEVPRIRYVFDVADTGARHDSRSPFLWHLEDQHMNAVHNALEDRYGADDFMMADQLEHIASQLAMTYWEENKRDILDIVDGSFLEEYDEYNVGASFRSAAAISISYALLSRCGLEPEERYTHEDFLSVFDWNTPDAANALGTAVSQISEQVLRQIEVTIKNYERSVEHERDSVSAERGLSDPGNHFGHPAPAALGQVRQDAEEVPSGASSDPVQSARPERPAAESSAGDRGNSQQPVGADDAGNGREERSDGGIESEGSNGLGGPDERSQESSGRNDRGGADLRIAETVEQTSLFPNEAEQQKQIENMVAASAEREKSSVLVLSDEEIEHALRRGSGFEGGKLRIAAFYASHPAPKAAQDFLKEEYGVGGHSHTYLSGMGGFVDYDSKAMRLSSRGYKEQMRMTWTVVEKHVRDMIENSRYLSADEQSRFDGMMRGMAGQEIPVPLPRYHYPPVEAETVLGETTLDLPAPREVNRGDIEAAIREWNDSLQSKMAVARFFREGHSVEEIAAFLKQEYGDDLPAFPVTVDGAAGDIPWEQAADIAREMVREDRFFTDDEREEVQRLSREADAASKYKLGFGLMGNGMTVWNELELENGDYKTVAHIAADRTVTFYDDDMPESVRERIIREAETSNPTISATQDTPVFSTPPREINPPSREEMPAPERPEYRTPGGQLYHAGDEIEWRTGTSNIQHIRIDRVDGDSVYITFPNKLPPINTSLNRQSVELQIDTGHFFVLEKAGNQEAPLISDVTEKRDSFVSNYGQTVFHPLSADSFREYTNLKRQYPDTIIGFELNGYFEFYGEDARKVAEISNAALLEKNTPAGQTAATGFSVPRWPSELRRIWSKGNNVYLAGENADGTHSEIKHVYGRDYLPLHAVVHIDNRKYSIDQVDFQKDTLTLRDITGTADSRFPSTRQETTGMVRSYLEDEPNFPIQETGENETLLLPLSIEVASEYNGLKARYPDAMIGFEQHGNYEFYGNDAELAGLILHTKILTKEIPGGHIRATGFPATQWQDHFKALWSNGNDVYLASEKPDGTHEEKKYYRKEDYIPLNAQIHFGGREYRVANVDYEHRKVSLQDLTALRETNETRFRELLPIEVRNMLEDQTDPLLFVESDLKHAPELDAEPIASASSEKQEEAIKEQDVPSTPEDVPPLQPGERLIPAHDGIPALRQIVIDLTGRGQEPAPPIKQKSVETQTPLSYSLHPGDTVYLDERPFVVEDVRLTEISFRDPAAVYPVFRVESRRSLERMLPLDDRNSQYRTDAERAGTPNQDMVVSKAVNFRITDDHLGEGGQKTKYANNVAAIRTLKAIEAENRHATPEEQEILSRYVGWGGVPQAFDPSNASWDSEFTELAGLLNDEEYELARASTLNAHYTSPTVIKAMYQALEQMGFRTGNVLEPSCGIGNFFGLVPESMSNSKLYGVELDSITGRIAQQLYPQAQISVTGFEKTDRRDFFDVAVGNVPFGSYKLADKRFDKHNFLIHDYFFAKALDQVRPGGVIAFITSKGTMDKQSDEVRKYIAQRADLLGAIRLPNNAFKANAGTEVTSDIIFLQKREQPLDIEPEWVHLSQTEDGIPINSYFADHPEMVLGKMAWDDSMYGNQKETACLPLEGVILSEQLAQAVQHITGEYHAVEMPDLEEGEKIQESIPATPDVKNYSYTVVDDKVYYRENSIMVRPELNTTAQERIKGMVRLRDCVHRLMDAQLDEYGDDAIHALQAELNQLYDSYTEKFGLINSRANSQVFRADSSYYLLCSLEILNENGELARKADMFTKRTIRQQRTIDHVDTAVEALAVSIAEKARVDVPYMAELTYKTEDEIAAELTGVIFRLPAPVDEKGKPRYVTADEYLSGNVRQKLREARAAADISPVFVPNVQALEKAQPKDLEASEIDVRLGATWVGKEYIQQFMEELFEIPLYQRRAVQVQFSEYTSEWHITNKNALSYNNVPVNLTYGTDRVNGLRILEDSLNLRDVRIYDIIEDPDGKEKRVLNQKATTLAQQKQQAVKDAFREWIWKDASRRETLVTRYNELFNSIRPREYDGRHITFSGMNPEISLREHQRNAIAHILYSGNTLLAHVVGAGKSFEMAGAAMESKRLGLCQKSMFVVPNHLTEQWAAEFLRLYPSAKILVTTKRDFEKSNRKKFCARIATGDYDAVIIGHSQFERIPVSYERQERMLQDQIEELTKGIQELKMTRGEQFSIKQLERTKKQLEGRLRKLQAQEKKDDVVTFEQLGVDRLFVDEAHSFKNMFLLTKMRNVAGLSTSEAQKSTDMFLKCRYMDEITGGRGVVFATGTPVSNSMTELYTMQRYLQYDTLHRNNMTHFDCWASTFGETVTAIELAPEGTGYRARTRFAKFFNLPELMTMFKEVADIKTADQLNLPTPEVQFETVVAQPTEHQKAMIQELSRRASKIHAGIDPRKDNMLKVTSDGRKLGLDQRMINPLLPDDPGSKVNQCVNNVFRIWQEGMANKLTQLIFCDISTPKGAPGKTAEQQTKVEAAPEKPSQPESDDDFGDLPLDEDDPQESSLFSAAKNNDFSVYEDIRDKLIARGVPREEIAFIHDADTEVKKKELFAKVRSGQVRVLLGSTAKMGAGTNVQDRLIASHDLDCPWRPGDLEQRAGRIVRQGNMNPKVHIYRYVTEGSFDSYLWQTVENKQKFISQIMTSKSPVRSCEDVDETALSYAEIKALCAGDDRIKEKMALDVDVARLRLMKSEHQSNQYRLEDKLLKQFPHDIEQSRGFLLGLQKDQDMLAEHPLPEKDFVGITILGKDYSDKEKAGEAILEACKSAKMDKEFGIGMYRGFLMYLTYNPLGNQFILSLKGEMTHPVELGPNAVGNMTRIENALGNIPKRMEAIEAKLESLNQQMATARAELGKPFPQEAELKEKSARLVELDASLNMDNARHGPEEEQAKPAPKRNREEAR